MAHDSGAPVERPPVPGVDAYAENPYEARRVHRRSPDGAERSHATRHALGLGSADSGRE